MFAITYWTPLTVTVALAALQPPAHTPGVHVVLKCGLALGAGS